MRDPYAAVYDTALKEYVAICIGWVQAGDELAEKYGGFDNIPKKVRKFLLRVEEIADLYLNDCH